MTFNEWLGTQGNMVLLHANCCRIAYEAGQQSQQAKVEELQKRVDAAIQLINEHYESDGMSGLYFMDIKEILEGEQALKGGG